MIMMYKTFEKRMKRLKGGLPEGVDRLTFSKEEREFLGNVVIAHDPLTKQVNEKEFIVTPVASHGRSLYVVCPFCGDIHVHGGIGSGTPYSGGRIPDCMSDGVYKITPIIA